MNGADIATLTGRGRLTFFFRCCFRHPRAAVGIGGGERCEVVLADDVIGGAHQRFLIHGIGIVKNIARQKRRTNIAAIDAIAIGLALAEWRA